MRCIPALLLLASATALAQDRPTTLDPRPVAAPTRDAGVYHVVSGTWSRVGATASLGPDVIYSATAPSGYFGTGWEGQIGTDEGQLPSTSHPLGGPQDGYVIDGFEFGYCSQADWVDWRFQLHDSYQPCDSVIQPEGCRASASDWILVPGAPTAGACWIVAVDLSGGAEFVMEADGGPCAPGYDGGGNQDSFGWSAVWTTGDQGTTGPLLSGYDPAWSSPGEGTCYGPARSCPQGATALGAQDFFHFEDGQAYGGCHFFGGYSAGGCGWSKGPPAQFHFQLFTDCANGTPGSCYGTACHDHSFQRGYLLLSSCSLDDDPVLAAAGMHGSVFAYALVGAGTGVVTNPPGGFGDLCLTGAPIGRYTADVAPVVEGAYSLDLIHGATGGGTGALPPPLGGWLEAGATWNFQVWQRTTTATSRFTSSLSVTFE